MPNHERQADEDLKKFFNKLLDVKEYVKKHYEASNDPILKEIFLKLDETIKETK